MRFGVGSAQCPRPKLESFARTAQRRYPNAYRQILAPLLATGRSQIDLGGLQALQRQYLLKRQGAPDFSQYAPLIGSSSSSSSRGLRL